MTVDEIYNEALNLPDESKEFLALNLVKHLEHNIDSDLEREHLKTCEKRINEAKNGLVSLIDGESVLQQARNLLNQ